MKFVMYMSGCRGYFADIATGRCEIRALTGWRRLVGHFYDWHNP